MAIGYTENPGGYWLADKGKNMRTFLEDFARSRNLDPLLAETWYNTPFKVIKKLKVSICVI